MGDWYPVFDPSILAEIQRRGFTIGETTIVDVPFERACEQMKKRGRKSDIGWQLKDLKTIEARFNLLFKSRYEWAWVNVLAP